VTNISLCIWIQDSKFKAQKKLLQSNPGFKIQDSRPRKNFFNPTSLDSRFKAEGLRIQEVCWGSDVLRDGWDGNKIDHQTMPKL
jgi:hypothetical protein